MAVFSTSAIAQGLNSAYFTQDYKYRHDMNPAFDNEQSYIAVPFLGNVNAKTLGTFGYKDVVLDNPLYPTSSDKKKTTFMNPYIDGALDGFRKGDNIMAVEGSVNHMWTISVLQMHPKGIIVCDDAATDELMVGTVNYFKDIERDNINPAAML